MNFTPQSINATAQGKKNSNALIVVLSFTDISAHILKGIYTACVPPDIEYGAIITPLMCKTSVTTLQRVQDQGMRLILGVPR